MTSTGWRLSARTVEHLAQLTGEVLDPTFLEQDVLFAAHFTVRPRDPQDDPVEAVLAELNRWLVEGRGGDVRLSVDNRVREGADRYDRLDWRTFRHGKTWAGELAWTHPHPIIRGTPCTTKVALSGGGGIPWISGSTSSPPAASNV